MARLTGENIENYSSGGNGGSYFSLKDDKDVARVRFLYSSASDIEGFSVHKVQVGDRERYVNCLVDEEAGKTAADCPFCRAGIKKQAKLFIPLFNEDTETIQIWERGQKYYGKIAGLCARYSNLASRVFEIERNGKKGDTKTTYNEYPMGDADGTTVQDILDDCGVEELVNPLGTIILDKTEEEMEYYLEHEEFPEDRDETPVRRRGSSRREEPETDNEPREQSRGRETRRGRGRNSF